MPRTTALLAVLLLLLLAACDNTPPTPAIPTPGTDNASLLLQATNNMRQLRSYRVAADGVAITEGQVGTISGIVDVANARSKLTLTYPPTLTVQLISIGAAAYVSTDAGQTWQAAPIAGGEVVSSLSKGWNGLQQSEINRANAAGAIKDSSPVMETIDGVLCKHIVANADNLPTLAAAGSTFSGGAVEIWISADSTPLIRQIRITGDDNGKPNTQVVRISDFNAEFVITAPTNLVKRATATP